MRCYSIDAVKSRQKCKCGSEKCFNNKSWKNSRLRERISYKQIKEKVRFVLVIEKNEMS
jgi:hypothetical protein